jgi:hypothetical protein
MHRRLAEVQREAEAEEEGSGLSRAPWRRSRVPVVGRVLPRVAEAAEYRHDLGAVAWGHAGERRADGRGGVRQVSAGQVAEPREVAGAGGASAEFAVMGAIVSDRAAVSPMENGRNA